MWVTTVQALHKPEVCEAWKHGVLKKPANLPSGLGKEDFRGSGKREGVSGGLKHSAINVLCDACTANLSFKNTRNRIAQWHETN